jgi:pilus assembly protein CpaE
MVKHITLVRATDRRPEELLHACGMQVVSISEAGLSTLAAPSAKQPDALLVDLRDGATVPSAVSAITRQHPSTGVVIIASALDPALLVDAMRAGVNEVVSEPLQQVDLENAINRVTGHRGGAQVGDVIGFVGAKGGVGTTTVAVNMATMLGGLSKPGRALLMDLHHAGGDAAVFTGAEPRFSVLDALDNSHRLDQSFLRTLVIGVSPHTDLLASPDRPSVGRLDPDRMRRVIDVAASTYKHTIIDLPRSDGSVLDALDQLKSIYIVANQELATVRSATRLAATLRQRYGREKVGVVLSRSDRQAGIAHSDIEKAVGLSVAHVFPSDYRVALQALNKGRPLALDNHNDLSASFRRFAIELSGVKSEGERARPAGLFGRLTQRRG